MSFFFGFADADGVCHLLFLVLSLSLLLTGLARADVVVLEHSLIFLERGPLELEEGVEVVHPSKRKRENAKKKSCRCAFFSPRKKMAHDVSLSPSKKKHSTPNFNQTTKE